jgi:uncharacterized membrane protein (UPF0182 family)
MSLVFILIGLLVLTIVGAIIANIFDFEWYGSLGFIISMISGIALVVFLILWPVGYYSYGSDIQQYKVTKQTIMQSRNEGKLTDYERAALTNTIIKENKKIADARYWNKTIFDWTVPEEYAKLPYLK